MKNANNILQEIGENKDEYELSYACGVGRVYSVVTFNNTMKILMHDHCNSSFQIIEGHKTNKNYEWSIIWDYVVWNKKRFIAAEKLIEDKALVMVNRCNTNKFELFIFDVAQSEIWTKWIELNWGPEFLELEPEINNISSICTVDACALIFWKDENMNNQLSFEVKAYLIDIYGK